MTRVLVVEDQASVVAIVRYHFENAGFEGVYATDVDEGWRALVGERPDAAVVDIKLPGADGWTLIDKVRSDGRFQELPIVVLTGLLEPEVVEHAAELGCEYLGKPFAASTLLAKIRKLVEEAAAHPRKIAEAMGAPRQQIKLLPVGVVILTATYQIEGKVHLAPELPRFSDGWEGVMRDNRHFVPLTEARVTARQSGDVVAESPFMEIRKSDILAVYPMQMSAEQKALEQEAIEKKLLPAEKEEPAEAEELPISPEQDLPAADSVPSEPGFPGTGEQGGRL